MQIGLQGQMQDTSVRGVAGMWPPSCLRVQGVDEVVQAGPGGRLVPALRGQCCAEGLGFPTLFWPQDDLALVSNSPLNLISCTAVLPHTEL